MNPVEKIERRIADLEGEVYKFELPDFENSRRVFRGYRDPLLTSWHILLDKLMPVTRAEVKLPQNAKWYDALYTSEKPALSIKLSEEKTVRVFGLRNQPADMGSMILGRLVLSETDVPDESLLIRFPFLISYAGAGGVFAAESPLMFHEDEPEQWLQDVEFVMSTIRSARSLPEAR